MKIWNVITRKPELMSWYGTWRARALRRFPEVDEYGFVWLEGRPYVPDDTMAVPEHYHDNRTAGMIAFLGFVASGAISLLYGTVPGVLVFLAAVAGAYVVRTQERTDMHYYWGENEPAQKNMRDVKSPGSIPGITGDVVREFGMAHHMSEILQDEMPWGMIVAALLAGLGIGAIVMAVVSRIGGK